MHFDVMAEFPVFIHYIVVVIFGLLLGSFTTAISYRVSRGFSWAFDAANCRSVCTSCNRKLNIADLVPVFSWFFLKGRCRRCKASISFTYPLIEILVVGLVVAAFMVFGFTVDFFWAVLAVPFLVALAVIDLKTYSLPNQLVLILFVIGVLRLGSGFFTVADFEIWVLDHVLAALIYGGGIWLLGQGMGKVLSKDALGMGDVKLMAVFGLWLGLNPLPWFLMVSGVLAIIYGLLWKKLTGYERFPFGPALIAGFYILLLAGSSQAGQIHLH